MVRQEQMHDLGRQEKMARDGEDFFATRYEDEMNKSVKGASMVTKNLKEMCVVDSLTN